MRKAGLGIGFYYPWDDKEHPDCRWFSGHPDRYIPGFIEKYPERWANFVKFEKDQLKELMTQYGTIDYFWFDGSYQDGGRPEDALPILKMMRELQPDIILNNRGTMNMADVAETPESCIPRTVTTGYWETCMGLPGKGGWVVPRQSNINKEWMTIGDGWFDYQGPNMEYKSIKELIQSLCTVASKGGNLLLGVGPLPDGTIPEPQVELLEQMGKWLRVNGMAIYGTTRSPLKSIPEWGVITRKGQKIYLLVFDWPERTGILSLNIKNNIKTAKLLATGEFLPISRINSETIEIQLPEEPAAWEPHIHAVKKAPNEYTSVVELEVEGEIQP
jgi:alpha-L-fucosidase